MKKLIKNTAILATGLLMVTGCSGDFLDHTPTDSVDSGLAPTPENAERIFIGAWYNLMEYGTTYANIGYRACMSLCKSADMALYKVKQNGKADFKMKGM